MIDIKKEFNYREETVIGRNPKTNDEIKVTRDYWTYKGIDFSWNIELIKDYKDIELTSLDLNHIKTEIKKYIECEDNGLEEDQLKEMQVAYETLKEGNLTDIDKIFCCYVYDSTFYSWITMGYYRHEVEAIRNAIGNYDYMLFSKFYPEEDDEEEID